MKGMKLEHIRIGKSYMWRDRRVEVRAITDALREGDPESEESDEDLVAGDVVTVAGVDEDGTPRWQYAPIADLRPLPVSVWAEDIRANYAHRYAPDATSLTINTTQPAPGTVYERWADVSPGSLTLDKDGDGVHRGSNGNNRFWYPRKVGSWCPGTQWDSRPRGDVDDYAPWTFVAMVPDAITGEQVADLVKGKR